MCIAVVFAVSAFLSSCFAWKKHVHDKHIQKTDNRRQEMNAHTRTYTYIVQSTLAHTISIMWRGANTKNEVSLKLMKIPFNSKIWAIKSISPSARVPHWLFACRKVIAISFGFTRCLFHTIIFLFLFSLRLSPYLNILLPFHLHCYDLLLVISLLSSSVQIWWIVVCVYVRRTEISRAMNITTAITLPSSSLWTNTNVYTKL